VSAAAALAGACALLFLSAVFSGAETGVYSVSRARLEAEAEAGRPGARLLAALLRRDGTLLVSLLIGNNLVLELMTRLAQSGIERAPVPRYAHELAVALLLTPLVFLLGELVPKDLFRRRPHLLLTLVAPLLAVFRWAAMPLAGPLAVLASGLERLLGLHRRESARVLRREEMAELLAEGRRSGALGQEAEGIVRNVLVLQHTPLARIAVPWNRVEWIDLDRGPEAARASVLQSGFTRLPALRTGSDGKRAVVGYLHQLDVLAQVEDAPLEALLRPILELGSSLPLDRAVARFQASGQRLAVVGTRHAPRGLVSLSDLFAALASQPRFAQPSAPARIGSVP
jgi:CBS domain containing-hemolysin-like protein